MIPRLKPPQISRASTSRSAARLGHGLDFWVVLCVGLAALKLLHGFERIFDPPLGDESYYLFNGVKLAEQGLPTGEWSPLYAVWYWFLAGMEWTQDNLNLYFFNQRILVVSTASALYLAMRSLAVSRMVAIVTTWIYLLSSIPVILPRPSHLVLLIILVFIALQNYLRANLDFYFFLGGLLLVCSFIRPEFYLSFLIVSAYITLLFSRAIWAGGDRILQSLKFLIYTFLASLLIGQLGIPTAAGDRGWQAFCQHFSLRWSWHNPTELNPWLDSSIIIKTVFGKVSNLRAAMVANPTAFLNHILGNIKGIFQNTIDILDGSLLDQSPSLKDINPQWDSVLRLLELGIFIFAIGFVIWTSRQRSRPILTPSLQRMLTLFLFLGVPVFPAIAVIFPRYHYLIIHLVLGMICLSYLASQGSNQAQDLAHRELPARQVIAVSLVLLAVTPTLATGWCFFGNLCWVPPRSQPILANVETIQLMRQLQPDFKRTYDRPPNIFAAELEYRPFVELGNSFNLGHLPDSTLNVMDFVRSHQIDWIVLSPALQQDRRLKGNEAWQRFLQNPGSGVQQLEISGTDRRLLRLR